MKSSLTSSFFFALLLVLSFGMKRGEAQYQVCSYGTVEMERCSIAECTSQCHDKVPRSTGKCIAIDTCCCVTRAKFRH
ncbi:hypothetical protein RND81_12G214800 [Saponaria officinalis]|uniref:Uncharacterized protein n=1 Tax=Saponaria officinalis TaxID=3572 RepID=A0AAW1HDR8_SAPOF